MSIEIEIIKHLFEIFIFIQKFGSEISLSFLDLLLVYIEGHEIYSDGCLHCAILDVLRFDFTDPGMSQNLSNSS